MVIGVLELRAPAGISNSNLPSGDISDPPDASMVALDGVPIEVPIGVGVPPEFVLGDVGLLVLQEEMKMQAQNANRTLSVIFIVVWFA